MHEMPSPSVTLCESPVQFMDELFEKLYVKEELPLNEFVDEFFKNRANIFADETTRETIPLVGYTTGSFPDGTLVRVRCMVKDMDGPEFYMGAYHSQHVSKRGLIAHHCGIFKDVASLPDDYELMEGKPFATCERLVFTGVPIPCETDWVKEHWKNVTKSHSPTKSAKRSLPQNTEMDEGETKEKVNRSETSNAMEVTETSEELQAETTTTLDSTEEKDENSFAYSVKVYLNGDNIKLNDMVEFVGVISAPPSYEIDDVPGSVILPNFHVIHFTILSHSNPLVPVSLAQPILADKWSQVRTSFLQRLTDFLAGDSLAAEYLLCHLISSVYIRRDFMAIGKFSLNFYGSVFAQRNFATSISRFLSDIVHKKLYIPMSVEALSSKMLVPRKNYSTGRLDSALLQLAAGTQLIMDEMLMQPGHLNDNGVRNIAALRTLISSQKLDYDFHYHTCEFTTDYVVLIISEGKSMLGSDCYVKVDPNEKSMDNFGNVPNLESEQVNLYRQYLTSARMSPYHISAEMQSTIEQDFVTLRQNNQNITGQNLHSTLLLARLIALSKGEKQLTTSSWQRAKVMEQLRNSR